MTPAREPHRRLANTPTRTMPKASNTAIGVMNPASPRPNSRQVSTVGIHHMNR